jgi:hypothetical protein
MSTRAPRFSSFGALALAIAACSAAPDNPNQTSSGVGGSTSSTSEAGVGGSFMSGTGGGGPTSACKVADEDMDAIPYCTVVAPPDSFDPVVQWQWTGPSQVYGAGSWTIPLVGNFTDDNGDGAIDLCDTPDVIVNTVVTHNPSSGVLYMLAGDTGKEEFVFPGKVDPSVTAAFGDLDGDGLPEIVAVSWPDGQIVIYGHDGTLKQTGDVLQATATSFSGCTAIAIYDLEGDGSPEIIAGFEVFDAKGKRLWGVPDGEMMFAYQYNCPTATAADLDGDGKLEVLFGNQTYHSDGTLYWSIPGPPGNPQIANLDDDPEPEILITSTEGITVVEHDGTLKFGPVRPTDPNPSAACWDKPAVVHDFDGDGKADAAIGTCTDYSMYALGGDATPKWSANVTDISGVATGTAFDFLGDGIADAIYADETQAYVFDGKTGKLEMIVPRTSATTIEYPVVVDVDNDGSANLLVVSNNYPEGTTGPTLTVYRDSKNRWVRTRRIWNQHAYHVTNVREDGAIPKVMKKSWQLLDTFRANSQIDATGVCQPPK